MKNVKRAAAAGLVGVLGLSMMLTATGCGNKTKAAEQVVILF